MIYRVVFCPLMKKYRTLFYEREEDLIDRITGTFKEGVFKSLRQARAVESKMNKRKRTKNAEQEPRS